MEQRHVPVLLDRCVELLAPALSEPGAVLVDVTLGMGGHTEALLERLPHLRVVGLDRDPQAIVLASQRLARFADRFTAVHAVYDDVLEVVTDVVGRPVQGLLADLGRVLPPARRGRARLRLRAGRSAGHADGPDGRSERRRSAGHRRRARADPDPARVRRGAFRRTDRRPDRGDASPTPRCCAPGSSSRSCAPRSPPLHERPAGTRRSAPSRRCGSRSTPSSRCSRGRCRPRSRRSASDGRVVVLAYHSLEDRLVKRALARGATSSAPVGLPVEPETHRPYLELLTRGAETASPDEIAANPRSSSVRLRAARRLRPTPDHLRTVSGRWVA